MDGKITGNVSIMMVGHIRPCISFGLCPANGESVEAICQLCEPAAWAVGFREAGDYAWAVAMVRIISMNLLQVYAEIYQIMSMLSSSLQLTQSFSPLSVPSAH